LQILPGVRRERKPGDRRTRQTRETRETREKQLILNPRSLIPDPEVIKKHVARR
jgi:hypothetical protein